MRSSRHTGNSSGAIFRTKLDIIRSTHGGATERKTQRDSSGAIFRTKLVISSSHTWEPTEGEKGEKVAPKREKWHHLKNCHRSEAKKGSRRQRFEKWRHLPDKTGSSSSSHGGATERCQVFKWRHLRGQNWLSSSPHGGAICRHFVPILSQFYRPFIGHFIIIYSHGGAIFNPFYRQFFTILLPFCRHF